MALLCERCSSDDVRLVESEVGEGDGSGGGVEDEVGVNDGAVGLYLYVVAEQLTVPVLGRGREQGQDRAGAVEHLHQDIVWRGGGDVLQGLDIHRI